MKITSMKDLLVNELKDLYGAEHQILKALPKMIKAASNPTLRQGFEKHLEETKNQVTRLEQAFDKLGVSARRRPARASRASVKSARNWSMPSPRPRSSTLA